MAARVEGLAEPGGVCVSGKVPEELRKRLEIEFVPMGRQRVKNIAEPLEAWRVELRAQELAKRAVEFDPTFPRAASSLPPPTGGRFRTIGRRARRRWRAWLAAATHAVALDPNDGWARLLLSDRYAFSNDLALSVSELLRAADLAEGDAALMLEAGGSLSWLGQTERGVELVERGLRLDPGLVDESRWRQRDVNFFARRFEDAAAAAEASNDRQWPDGWKTLIYAQLGRTAELAGLPVCATPEQVVAGPICGTCPSAKPSGQRR